MIFFIIFKAFNICEIIIFRATFLILFIITIFFYINDI